MRKRIAMTWALMVFLSIFLSEANSRFLTSHAQDNQQASATISGMVTLAGQPAKNVPVAIAQANTLGAIEPKQQTRTDENGLYSFVNLTAGSYNIMPISPAFSIAERTRSLMPGKTVTVKAAEQITNVDFALQRGAVITGKVIRENREPVIFAAVRLQQVNRQGKMESFISPVSGLSNFTDDRGVYRLYGLPAGRYVVGIALPNQSYYPNTTDLSKAAIVEVSEGAEVTNIDIILSAPPKAYAVSGRIIDAETNKPLPNIKFGYSETGKETTAASAIMANTRANEGGEFRIDRLSVGRYSVFIVADETSAYYSEVLPFEVKDAPVSGLAVKAYRGANLSGVVSLEDETNVDALAKLAQVELLVNVESAIVSPARWTPVKIGAGGSFSVSGLLPGTARLRLSPTSESKGFRLIRLEHDGNSQTSGIEVKQGETIRTVRIILAYRNQS